MRHKLFLSLLLLCIAFLPIKKSHAAEMTNEMLISTVQNLQKTVESLQLTVQNQNEVIQKQGIQIEVLSKGFLSAPTPAPTDKISVAGSSQGFNPDIGLVGIVEAKSTQSTEDGEGNDTIALKELELNVSQYVDPYSRLDAVIAFNDEIEEQNVEIEEGYYTHWGLPADFLGQIGKFRPKIGKQNLLHSELLHTTDYPLVIRDFFGEEGLVASGARLQNHIPNPWDIPVEVTGEILRGNNGNSFAMISRRPIFNTHVKTFFETTDNSNLEFGWTTLFGDENPSVITYDGENDTTETEILSGGRTKYGVKVFGSDATWNWMLPEERKLKFQNEVYFQNRTTDTRHPNKNPWGFYSLFDIRLTPRWSAGVRYDYLKPLGINEDETNGMSPYVTFWQSEFANFKLQYSYTNPADGDMKPNHEVMLKANVIIGAHKHPVQ